mmetsp:Transcript_23481/g.51516  ORF Transcript_23481/g.51516 Transcript_23481/m.51516 type:complete len:252 (-) Transcript_23481:50-805(-)|eukprot:CAMPEP_0206473412 /NCGR_PEP_ID=MMETSP0324_2-20121206/32848_1 /ASSEMBLY_ACC=CAM_ASM_000836 /TAXON_ID=2866 /ORGANISM="Crypthecodinium cohnii, Strain Seligo" /LENGTH=251 /DNA_ID=CAMNT_0053948333 /DNA_START=25 /DNA_END=780 /DNA_ORIENTATION=-
MTLTAFAVGGLLLLAASNTLRSPSQALKAPGSTKRLGSPMAVGERQHLAGSSPLQRQAVAGPVNLAEWEPEPPVRIGHGFDIHRMTSKTDPEVRGPVIVGGVTFEDFDMGIVAHSDGDVVYHSVVDAIFGALTLPDIGTFFPDTDPRWKGAPSNVFMDEAWRQMDKRGYRISNIDVTIIAQAPRMIVRDHPLAEPGKPFDYKAEMVENVAELMGCPTSRVNVKARTHEKVDAVGEKRAISCHVVVILERKP